jgi:hypothetical protein
MGAARTRRIDSPRCFLHVPKSAGSSVYAALEAALPPGSIAPRRFDKSIFADFRDFGLLRQEVRDLVALDRDEVHALSSYRAVCGHFSLATLLQITAASSISTVLREPRARLLSLYMYWRVPGIGDPWGPYRANDHAQRPLWEFLSEPRLAPVLDNQVCRMLLDGDPRLPELGFAAQSDIESIAACAIEQLEMLGFVGVVELGDSAWRGLAQMFDVKLEPTELNVTEELEAPVATKAGEKLLTTETLDLIEQRSAADLLVYDHALTRAGLDAGERRRLTQDAFARQLVKLGDLLGHSSAREIQSLKAEIRRRDEDLDRLRRWLDAVHASASWRLTTPLRAASHGIRQLRPSPSRVGDPHARSVAPRRILCQPGVVVRARALLDRRGYRCGPQPRRPHRLAHGRAILRRIHWSLGKDGDRWNLGGRPCRAPRHPRRNLGHPHTVRRPRRRCGRGAAEHLRGRRHRETQIRPDRVIARCSPTSPNWPMSRRAALIPRCSRLHRVER